MGLMLAEIAIEILMIGSIVVVGACLVYLLYATVLESRLLRDARPRTGVRAVQRLLATSVVRDEPAQRRAASHVAHQGHA